VPGFLNWVENVASLNLSSGALPYAKQIGGFPPSPKGFEERTLLVRAGLCFWCCCFQQVELNAGSRGILCFLIGRMSGISFVPEQLRRSGLPDVLADSVEL